MIGTRLMNDIKQNGKVKIASVLCQLAQNNTKIEEFCAPFYDLYHCLPTKVTFL